MHTNHRQWCAAASVCAVAGLASANHNAVISSPTSFVADWSYVPDLDQRRAALPNNGAMYCVPASAMNWMIYVAHHGHPSVAPGNQSYWSWMQPYAYLPATALLEQMAALMNTHPQNGTNGANALAGATAWLAGENFAVFNYWTHDAITIDFQEVANWTLMGVPVNLSVGWYSGTEPLISRTGGHSVSVTHVSRSGPMRQIGFRDAADDNADLNSQSVFATQKYFLSQRNVVVNGLARIVDKVINYGSGYIDGMLVISPLTALTEADDGLSVTLVRPYGFDWDISGVTETYTPAITGPIQDVKFIPGSPEMLILTSEQPGDNGFPVYRFNPGTMETTFVGGVPGAAKFIFGPGRDAYFLAGGAIMRYMLDAPVWAPDSSVYPPDPIHALAYDDATDTLLAFSENTRKVYRFAGDLQGEALDIDVLPFNPSFPFEPGQVTHFAVSPADGSVYFVNDGSDRVLRVEDLGDDPISVQTILDGELLAPRAVQVADNGRLFITSDDRLNEYRYDSTFDTWILNSFSGFAGVLVGEALDIPHSRTNFAADSPEYNNVLPAQFAPGDPDCAADMTGDQTVDGQDLAVFLAAWGAAGDLTDLNGDGTTDGADLAMLLAAWGPCA